MPNPGQENLDRRLPGCHNAARQAVQGQCGHSLRTGHNWLMSRSSGAGTPDHVRNTAKQD